MGDSLVKKSDFIKIKSKFFINRIFMYFSFLLVPILIQNGNTFSFFAQSNILIIYLIFMVGQWYLFGKEIDHRFKIYFRVNSSMERIVYRVFMGSMAMLFLFNFFYLFPESMTKYLFWGFFGLFGLFYSWPTRGKIIEDSMTDQFGEMKFLDSFERTVFVLSVITFLVSLPELALFENIEALKLYFDPNEKVSHLLWNYLSVLYHPFSAYPKLYNLIWSFHFYFISMGLFVTAFYGMLRHFFSRRLSILGLFALLSSWSYARALNTDYFFSFTTTIPLLWTWAVLWTTRSGTYRSGLFTGLMCSFAVLANVLNIVLLPITICMFYFVFLKEYTEWYRRQWIKYNLLGVFIASLILLSQAHTAQFMKLSQLSFLFDQIGELIYRKAFFVIAPLGLLLCLILFLKSMKPRLNFLNFDLAKLKEILICFLVVLFVGLFINPQFLAGFSLIWILVFFSLVPLEWIFQSISRLRSKRNLIYALYILVCILDSHLENRIRVIGKIFLDQESLKYLIQF